MGIRMSYVTQKIKQTLQETLRADRSFAPMVMYFKDGEPLLVTVSRQVNSNDDEYKAVSEMMSIIPVSDCDEAVLACDSTFSLRTVSMRIDTEQAVEELRVMPDHLKMDSLEITYAGRRKRPSSAMHPYIEDNSKKIYWLETKYPILTMSLYDLPFLMASYFQVAPPQSINLDDLIKELCDRGHRIETIESLNNKVGISDND